EEPAARGVRIRPTLHRPRAVLAAVVHNVADCVTDALPSTQRHGEVAFGKDVALRPMPHRVQRLGDPDAEGLQTARQPPPVIDLDDQMQVILLDRVVHEDEPALLLAPAERPLETTESAWSAQARQTSTNPPHDVDRALHLGPRLVRNSRAT